ncbi:MAG: hypothetical protein JSS27_03880 [Planctomycetes bacterium]|nr:hypothetical protein [Planctomycetota bacterium]
MNRFEPFASRGSVTGPQIDLTIPQPATTAGGHTLPTAFFTPLHYEPNYAYPLLVWLHSPLNDETQLRRVMPHVSLRNYVAVSVRGTLAVEESPGDVCYTWSQAGAHVAQAEQAVFEAIDQATRRYNIANQRIFLAGHTSGGTMALRVALAHPNVFAGVMSLDGSLPHERRPLSRLADLRKLPVFLTCGQDSERYPAPSVCDNLRLLHSAGMSVDLRQYPCGNEIMSAMLADMDRWMMNLIVGASTASATPV